MQANLLFPHKQLLHERFLKTDVGQLYQAIPFEELAKQIPAPKQAISGKGCKPWFDMKGAIGLLILKHYLCCSDEMLIQRINTDWSLQFFCGIQLGPAEMIKDTNLPSTWRGYIGRRLNIDALQKQLADFWKPYMEETNIGSQDATCYESRIAYPTDIKLLWKCCNEVQMLLQRQRKSLKLRKSRNNYDKHKKQYLSYQKRKKKTKRQEKKLRKKLLKYLLRLTTLEYELQQKHDTYYVSVGQEKRMQTILKV